MVLSARLVCVGLDNFNHVAGRGMKNGENFQLLYDLADKIGAAGLCFTTKMSQYLLGIYVLYVL